MVAFEMIFYGVIAHIDKGFVAQLLTEEAQGLSYIGGRTAKLIDSEADIAFSVEMSLEEFAEGNGEPLRELGTEAGQNLAIENDGGIEVYLDGGGVVVFHLSHFVEVLLSMGSVGQYLVVAAVYVVIAVHRGVMAWSIVLC